MSLLYWPLLAVVSSGRCTSLSLALLSDLFDVSLCSLAQRRPQGKRRRRRKKETGWRELQTSWTLVSVCTRNVTHGPHLTVTSPPPPPPQPLMQLELPRLLTWQKQGSTILRRSLSEHRHTLYTFSRLQASILCQHITSFLSHPPLPAPSFPSLPLLSPPFPFFPLPSPSSPPLPHLPSHPLPLPSPPSSPSLSSLQSRRRRH